MQYDEAITILPHDGLLSSSTSKRHINVYPKGIEYLLCRMLFSVKQFMITNLYLIISWSEIRGFFAMFFVLNVHLLFLT